MDTFSFKSSSKILIKNICKILISFVSFKRSTKIAKDFDFFLLKFRKEENVLQSKKKISIGFKNKRFLFVPTQCTNEWFVGAFSGANSY